MGLIIPIDKAAEQIARRQHEGQTRWDKSVPYIVHPERIAAATYGEEFKAAAWLHDVVEDTDMTLDELRSELEQLSGAGHKVDLVIELVDALTRREGESYTEFILRIKASSVAAAELKSADISDNLRDLKKGAMKDKYEMALWILGHDCMDEWK